MHACTNGPRCDSIVGPVEVAPASLLVSVVATGAAASSPEGGLFDVFVVVWPPPHAATTTKARNERQLRLFIRQGTVAELLLMGSNEGENGAVGFARLYLLRGCRRDAAGSARCDRSDCAGFCALDG